MSNYIVIVSGLPRSGTSMMMRMLEAGGLDVLVDNVKGADEDNPKGYYEFERVKGTRYDSSWLNDVSGKAVKVVSKYIYDLPLDQEYRIIFMKRSINEVLTSQKRMLERKGFDPGKKRDQIMSSLFTRHLAEVSHWISTQKRMSAVHINYCDIIENPLIYAMKVNELLDRTLDISSMAKEVEPSLYRHRSIYLSQ